MTQFLLGTWAPVAPAAFDHTYAEPLRTIGARALAIEVIRDDKYGEYAILFSAVDNAQAPRHLECLVGFANGTKACSVWRDRGFPLIDAVIEAAGSTLTVTTPYFAAPGPMRYEDRLLQIAGIAFGDDAASPVMLAPDYRQFEQAPDDAMPASYVERRDVVWKPARTNVRDRGTPTIALGIAPARVPSLAPFATGSLTMARAWTGSLTLPARPRFPADEPHRVRRVDTFGMPAFRFEDVEVLGFRIDLERLRIDGAEGLAELVAPLNLHLGDAGGGNKAAGQLMPMDFRYRAATTTLIVELLRYGKMRQISPLAPLRAADYQSQHELVVRILVGRVDDDTAQAHSPAIWVPAIFVDNPWSKVVGRDLQGFDKRMANFCTYANDGGLIRLRPDGCVAGVGQQSAPAGEPVPLARVMQVNLAGRAGKAVGPVLLEVDCPPERYANFDAFENIDLELAMGSTSLAALRWQQGDFEDVEFRRSFARAATFRTLKGFRSIQVSPVGKRALEPAWITGTFAVDDDLRIARPAGVAGITLHCPPGAPTGWKLFCKLLGADDASGTPQTIGFPTGTWYRLQCAMSLTIDNGFE